MPDGLLPENPNAPIATCDLRWSESGTLQQRYWCKYQGSIWLNVPKTVSITQRPPSVAAGNRRAATADEVIGEMEQALSVKQDQELAEWLGTLKQNIASRRLRNSVPYEYAVRVALATGIPLDDILTRPVLGGGV